MHLDQRIAFVTCERHRQIHDDDRLVADELQRRGFQVTAAEWTDPDIDWPQFACVVIRAAWDYHLDQARYAAWLRQCDTQGVNLWNPAAVVLANLDKRYLAAFADAGVAIVPIHYIERGETQSLPAVLERRNWTRAVVKPAVSASAFGTWRTSLASAAADQRRFDDEVRQRSLLVQPFVDQIVDSGEWSIVFFDGEYSHAVLKTPASGDFRVQEELGGHGEPREPSPAIVAQAQRVLSQVAGPAALRPGRRNRARRRIRPDGAGDQRTVSLHWLVEWGGEALRRSHCSPDRWNRAPPAVKVRPARAHSRMTACQAYGLDRPLTRSRRQRPTGLTRRPPRS